MIPASTTVVVVVAALDVLGAPLDEALVHRVELVAAADGRSREARCEEAALLALALAAASSYPSRIPPAARGVVFLNKADDGGALGRRARGSPRGLRPAVRAWWSRAPPGRGRAVVWR